MQRQASASAGFGIFTTSSMLISALVSHIRLQKRTVHLHEPGAQVQFAQVHVEFPQPIFAIWVVDSGDCWSVAGKLCVCR